LERLILASRSPRRRELLHRLGVSFEILVPEVDETCDLPAGEAVREISLRKARAAALLAPGAYILAADTLVSVEGEALGKPRDAEDAFRMLHQLSGRTHQVYSGVTVISPQGRCYAASDRTDVTFCEVPEEEIASSVASGEPFDKAGAYALQGQAGCWITRLEGSDTSVIGLPLYLVRRLLLEAGYPLGAGAP